jgi:hypothetical protein
MASYVKPTSMKKKPVAWWLGQCLPFNLEIICLCHIRIIISIFSHSRAESGFNKLSSYLIYVQPNLPDNSEAPFN